MKYILISIITICLYSHSIGQVKIAGGVYTDSLLSNPIKNVKIVIESNGKKTTIKSAKNGCFETSINSFSHNYSFTVKKKGFITVRLVDFSFNKDNTSLEFDTMLKKSYSLHDEEYEGSSEIFIKTNE